MRVFRLIDCSPFDVATIKRRRLFEHRRPSQDGVEWRAKLVRRGRQELVLRAIGFFGLCARRLLAGQQPCAFFIRVQAIGDIAGNLGRADDDALSIAHGRYGQ